MDLSPQRQQVAHALRTLDVAMQRLVDALSHRPVWVSLEAATTDSAAIRQACEAYSAINYAVEDTVGNSVVCLGVIGAPPDVLRRARAVNAAKAVLKDICAPLRGLRIRIPVKGAEGPTKAVAALRVILRSIQRSDLNLLAAYRKIPILSAPPATVTYTRAHTRAVYRKSVHELMQLLTNLDVPGAAADRERLEALNRRETHLALVKDRYQNIRANVLYSRLDPRGRGRMQIAAELPLMYALGRRLEHPEVSYPAEHDPAPNKPSHVRQAQLELQPFLQSLPAYRYTH
jgi:hypothetical protein